MSGNNNFSLVVVAALLASLGIFVGESAAGVYEDSLTRCLVSSADKQDRETLVRWTVIAYSQHPAISDIVTIPAAEITLSQRSMAAMVEKLFLQECLLEAREAGRYEGEVAVLTSFKLLAQIAGREIVTNPNVMSAIEGYIAFTDEDRFMREVFGQ